MFSEYYFYIVSFMADKFVEDGPTIFRIDRIKKLKGTGENFEVSYLERFEDGEFRKRVQFMLSGKLRTVKFEYTGILEVVQDRLPTAEVVEEIKLDDGTKKYVITAEVYGKGIDMWLKSQGDKVKVVEEKESSTFITWQKKIEYRKIWSKSVVIARNWWIFFGSRGTKCMDCYCKKSCKKQ